VLAIVLAGAQARTSPTADAMRASHAALYAGCTVPSIAYVGRFRGSRVTPELIDYEVGIGPTLPDGYPERVGVWASDVERAADQFFAGLHRALSVLDDAIAPGTRPTRVDELHEVVSLAAEVHGEWVRIHPFVGQTAIRPDSSQRTSSPVRDRPQPA